MEVVQVLGAGTTRADTTTLSPRQQFIAAGTADSSHVAWDGGNSRIELLRLRRKDGEPERGRLEIVASIPAPSNCRFRRLAWSTSANLDYPCGLLAGADVDGVVYVWNPDSFSASGAFRLKLPQVNKLTDVKIKKIASKMSREVENLYMNQMDDDWYVVKEDCEAETDDWELVNMKAAALLDNKSSVERAEFGPILLKIPDLEGPVLGLAFNNQYPDMLATADKADKLNIYHIDYPVRNSTSKYEFADSSEKAKNARVTFMEWHPHCPAMLLSTSDAGISTLWDIREKRPTLSFEDTNGYCSEVHWSPKKTLQFAVSSFGQSDTVKIWDLAQTKTNYLKLNDPVSKFGPKRGVTTLSWSAAADLILTTDVGGGIDCWGAERKERVELSGVVSNAMEARWCEAKDEFVVSTTDDVKLCKLLKPPVAM